MKDYIQKLLCGIDYEYFTYYSVRSGIEGVISTYPTQWAERYISNHYENIDFVFNHATSIPFFWGETFTKDITPDENRVFYEAHDFGINQGVSTPLFSNQKEGLFSLALPKDERLNVRSQIDLQHKVQTIGNIVMLKDMIEKDKSDNRILSFHLENALKSYNETLAFQDDLSQILNDLRYGRLLQENDEQERARGILKEACQKLEEIV